jgi:hypothetical protein
MLSHQERRGLRGKRRVRQLRPFLNPLEPRAVPSMDFPGIAGVTVDPSGDVFISYNSTGNAGQQEAIAEVSPSGSLINSDLFVTTGSQAFPGDLTTVGSPASLPDINASNDILELQPDGQIFSFNPSTAANGTFDNLSKYTPNASNVFDLQSGSYTNLNSAISLASATYGDFGVYGSSLVVSAASNNWDFVMRVTYGASGGCRHRPGRVTVQRRAT